MKATQLITLLLVLFTGIGVASAKPKVAVLGLEVLDKTNVKASVDAARQLTEGLRAAANAGSGPFEVAPNSQREFLDEKIINQCEKEERDCLLKIAGNFGATSLVYGKVQLGDNKKSFQVQVFLLSQDKGPAKPSITSVSISASPQELQNAGKKIYNDLVGITSVGSIVIKSKTGKGAVYINNELRGQLVDGELKATQLADGEYRVRVQAEGYKKWEETVKVKAGQVTTIDADPEAEAVAKPPVDPEEDDKASRPVQGGNKDPFKLETRENTVSKGGSGKTVWKAVAIGGAAIAVGGGVWMYLENEKIGDAKDLADMSQLSVNEVSPFSFSPDCSRGAALEDPNLGTEAQKDMAQDAYVKGCKAAKNTAYAGVAIGVGSVVAIVGAYMGFIRSDGATESTSPTARRHSRKSRFAVTPIVSPDGGGATVRIDF